MHKKNIRYSLRLMLKLVCTLLGYNKFKMKSNCCVHYLANLVFSHWNKFGVYIMRQNKKLIWLQACFQGDVRVIWCNSIDDSLFQTYVINFVETVIDHYLLITLHVSQTITSCTHYISYILLNLVHDIVCEFVLAIQDCIFLDFNAKCV